MSVILSKKEVEQFVRNGYVRLDKAFPQRLAEEVVDRLWQDIPFERFNPESWIEPVVRLGMYAQKPFQDSLNTARLHSAFDQLVGQGKWIPCRSVGTFPIRFPTEKQPIDVGKHVDASFPGEDPSNYFEWRVNARSTGRALLMLALFSDVSEDDAPTVIYEGSHLDVARLLSTEGDQGLSFMELAGRLNDLPQRKAVHATGKAGTVFLCHPFLVHSAQPHRGSTPKFMAQPPLLLKGDLSISETTTGFSPVEQAIRLGLDLLEI